MPNEIRDYDRRFHQLLQTDLRELFDAMRNDLITAREEIQRLQAVSVGERSGDWVYPPFDEPGKLPAVGAFIEWEPESGEERYGGKWLVGHMFKSASRWRYVTAPPVPATPAAADEHRIAEFILKWQKHLPREAESELLEIAAIDAQASTIRPVVCPSHGDSAGANPAGGSLQQPPATTVEGELLKTLKDIRNNLSLSRLSSHDELHDAMMRAQLMLNKIINQGIPATTVEIVADEGSYKNRTGKAASKIYEQATVDQIKALAKELEAFFGNGFPVADRMEKIIREYLPATSAIQDRQDQENSMDFLRELVADLRKQKAAERREVERLQGQMIELAKDGAEERMRLGTEIKRLRNREGCKPTPGRHRQSGS